MRIKDKKRRWVHAPRTFDKPIAVPYCGRVDGLDTYAVMRGENRIVFLLGERHVPMTRLSNKVPHLADLIQAYRKAYGSRFVCYVEYPTQGYHGYIHNTTLELYYSEGAIPIDVRSHYSDNVKCYPDAVLHATGYDFVNGQRLHGGHLTTHPKLINKFVDMMAPTNPEDSFDMLVEYHALGCLHKESADIVFIVTGNWHTLNMIRALRSIGYKCTNFGDNAAPSRGIKLSPLPA